jgi:hypothetical protein
MRLLAALLFVAPCAMADPMIYNGTPGVLTLSATMPNGAVKKADLAGLATGISSTSFLLSPGIKSITVAAADDTGKSVWTGKVNADDSILIVPSGAAAKGVYAGVQGSPATPQATLFMNITGEALSLDLEGHNGVGAHRGIIPPATFEPKKLVKLDPKEVTFDVQVKVGKADPVLIENSKLHVGFFTLVWKNDGKILLYELGKIAK